MKEMGSLAIAYSGGADSTFLLKVANDVLGDKVLAVTADSPTFSTEELAFSRKMARSFGARHKVIKTRELNDRQFVSNPANRCYFCKRELFSRLKTIARANELNFVADGSNLTDKKDLRPGTGAKQEFGIRSPLEEAGFTKGGIRRASKALGLVTWDKPNLACLASRIPYGTPISRQMLSRIQKAEAYLTGLGLRQVRLRHYNGLCRIEVSGRDLAGVINRRGAIIRKLKSLGYSYVTLDLEGYRTGSMNDILKAGRKK